jgi:hypothetical protein
VPQPVLLVLAEHLLQEGHVRVEAFSCSRMSVQHELAVELRETL